jgi:antitoxin component of MazEF toxin-antitoxin module
MEEIIDKETRKIIKVGNSLAITLPREYIKAHGLEAGDKMDLYFDEILHIEPVKEEDILRKLGKKPSTGD